MTTFNRKNEDNEEIQFSELKMRKFYERDGMVRFVVDDFLSKGNEEEYALEIAFNSLVLNDFIMEDIYKTL